MRTLLLFALLSSCLASSSQTPAWSWVRAAGASGITTNAGGTDRFTSTIVTDLQGNSYVTGHFSGTVAFGTVSLSSPNFPSVFTAKYDSSGNCLWAKHFGAAVPPPPAPFQNCNAGRAIAIDSLGACYVTGVFNGAPSDTIHFGNSKLYGYDNSRSEIFLVKYDANGNEIWATQSKYLGGVGVNTAASLSVDKAGNSWLACYMNYNNMVSFGNLPSIGAGSYVVKHNAQGVAQWAATLANTDGPPNGFFPTALKHGTNGTVLVTGYLSGTCTAGTSPPSTITAIGGSDVLVFKLNSTGSVNWVKQFGHSQGSCFGNAIDTDPAGNTFFTGGFYSKITLGTNTLTCLNPSSSSNPGVFISKLDSLGHVSWANLIGLEDANVGALRLSSSGKIYISGSYKTQSFYCNTGFPGGSHLFVEKLDTSGSCLWGHYASGDMMPAGIGLDSQENVYVAGNINSSGNFDSHTVSPAGTFDALIAKLTLRSTGNPTITGVTEIPKNEGVLIYPNPFDTEFTISFAEPVENLSIHLLVYDQLGQELLRLNPRTDKQFTVRRENLAPGLYTYKLLVGEKLAHAGKLIAH